MNAAKKIWENVEKLFHELADLSPEQQDKILERLKVSDPEIYEYLYPLLESDRTAHPLFNQNPRSILQELADDGLLTGTSIGSFQLEEMIGQGAMGTVFKASRSDGQFEQTVAIKLLRPNFFNSSSPEFFKRERQILARLNHPNIARLYDGGITSNSRPFFTMEWVEGLNLIDYVEKKKAGLNERLDLFLQVSEAVRFAHQSLVAHLDMKPLNIIINENGQVKLLDFGVSKMLDDSEQSAGSFTLAYASPEQINRDHPNTISDIYALGVILFELLSGAHPFKEQLSDPSELKTAILEGNYASFQLKDDFGKILFEEDLACICRKAMQTERSLRYQSVDEMLRDITHFKQHYPVSARKPSWQYKGKKYYCRNRKILLTSGVAAMILLSVTIYYTFQLRAQRNLAQLEAKKANQVTQLMSDVFMAADPNVGGADTITAVQLLDQGVSNLRQNLGNQPALYADMLMRLAPIYLNLGQYEKGMKLAQEAEKVALNDNNISAEKRANASLGIANAYYFLGRLDTSQIITRKAIQQLMKLEDVSDESMATALFQLGNVSYDLEKYQQADSAYEASLVIYKKYLTPPDVDIAGCFHMIGATARKMGQTKKAENYLMHSLEMKKQLYNEPHLEIAYTYNHLGSLYLDEGKDSLALVFISKSLNQRRAILGEYHVETIASMGNLARTYLRLGHPEKAVPLYEIALRNVDSSLGKNHHYYAGLLSSLGHAMMENGELDQAKKILHQSLYYFEKLLPPGDPRSAAPIVRLGEIAMKENKPKAALSYFEKGLSLREKGLPKGNIQIAQSQQALGECLLTLGKYSTAIEYLEEARDGYQSESGDSTQVPERLNLNLAIAYKAVNNLERAGHYQQLIAIDEE